MKRSNTGLVIRILGFIWRPRGIKDEEMSLKKFQLGGKIILGAQFSSWPEWAWYGPAYRYF